MWQFVGLCLILPTARAFSTYIISTLGQNTVMELRAQLSRRILAAPLLRLEEIGSHRLLAALTQDVSTIVMAMQVLPLLFVHGAVVVGSLIYLGWLSGKVLLIVLGFLAVGVVTYQIPMMRATAYQRASREEADELYGHFRAITGGFKELKLHYPRQDGLIEGLDVTGRALKRLSVTASTIYSAAAGWGQLVVFGMIGCIIFLVPSFEAVGLKTMTGYALILLYMMTPMEVMLESIPHLARAQVSFRKIDDLGLSLDAARGPALRLPGAPVPAPRMDWESLELGASRTPTTARARRSVHAGAHRPDAVAGGDGVPGGRQRQRQDHAGQAAPGAVRAGGRGAALGRAPVTDGRARRLPAAVRGGVLGLLPVRIAAGDGFAGAGRAGVALPVQAPPVAQGPGGGRQAVHHRPVAGAAQAARPADGVPGGPAHLPVRRVGGGPGPGLQGGVLPPAPSRAKARGKTVVVISHDDHYYGVADRIIKLDYGQIEYDGSPKNFQYRPAGVPIASAQEA